MSMLRRALTTIADDSAGVEQCMEKDEHLATHIEMARDGIELPTRGFSVRGGW
jgi:hypothetical protein